MSFSHDLERPILEEYYMSLAYTVAARATCLNRYVGCVIVSEDNRSILSTGYNGVPANLPHCITCRRREEGYGPGEGLHRSRAAHAEASAITQAAKYGKNINKGILYCTALPCNECSKSIINAGIKRVVFCEDYPGSEARTMLEQANLEVFQIDKNKVINGLKNWVNNI